MKNIIIRWSNRKMAIMMNEGYFKDKSFSELAKLGIIDILPNNKTGEPMLILDGLKQTNWIGNTKE